MPKGINHQIRTGVFHNALGKYSKVIIDIFVMAILARLISPKIFGVVAILTVFSRFFEMSSLSLGSGIIQNKELDKMDHSILFNYSIILSLIFSVIFFLMGGALAKIFDNSIYNDISLVFSISIFFAIAKFVPESLLQKDKNFKSISIVYLLNSMISSAISIYLAFNNYGIYSLLVRIIIFNALSLIFFIPLSKMKLSNSLKIKPIQKIYKFTINRFFSSLINYFSRNLDNLIIGKYFGETVLGFYDKAYRLMMIPIQNLTFVITPVLHPIYSDYQKDSKTIWNSYFVVLKILTLIGIPVSLVVFFTSKELIFILLGEQWVKSVPVLKAFSFSIWVQLIISTTGAIFMSFNKTRLLLLSQIVGAVIIVIPIFIGAVINKFQFIYIGITMSFIFIFIIISFLMIRNVFKIYLKDFMNVFTKPLIVGLFSFFVVFVIDLSMENILISFIIKILLILSLYSSGLFITKEHKYLFNLIKNVR